MTRPLPPDPDHRSHALGHLLFRPSRGDGSAPAHDARPPVVRGRRRRLGLGGGGRRDGLLYVPTRYDCLDPPPLLLLLHGAGADAADLLGVFQQAAERHGIIVLAPDSRGVTWDALLRGYGPDVAFIDRALAWTFERHAVDAHRLAVAGFSDGASYALSLGVANGDLLPAVIALSPGFLAPTAQRGVPRLFVAHGTHDDVLPIDSCSRRIVPALRRAGYDVRYSEFDGYHSVPQPVVQEAMEWWLGEAGTEGACHPERSAERSEGSAVPGPGPALGE